MGDINSADVLPNWGENEDISAAKLSRTNQALNRIIEGVPPPKQSLPVPNTITVRQFKIVSVQSEYYVCNPYDGLTADTNTTIKIARPPLHRNTIISRSGITYTYTSTQQRTATQGATTETQLITPSIVVGDIIFALGGDITGGVGVKIITGTNVEFLKWVDINADGRAWAKQ